MLFGQIAYGVEEYVKLLTEHIVQLGGHANGTADVVIRRTSLDRYPLYVANGNGHIEALPTVLASLGKHIRYAIGQATDLIDANSSTLFIEISRDTDTWSSSASHAVSLRAHQGEPQRLKCLVSSIYY